MMASPYTLLYIIADNDLVPIMRSLPTVRWFVLMMRYLLIYRLLGNGVDWLMSELQRQEPHRQKLIPNILESTYHS